MTNATQPSGSEYYASTPEGLPPIAPPPLPSAEVPIHPMPVDQNLEPNVLPDIESELNDVGGEVKEKGPEEIGLYFSKN